jgi:integrase
MKLTAKAVNELTLPPGKGDVIFFDDAMPGFGFRIRQGAGGKVLRSWIIQYRRVGQTRRMLIGSAEVVGAEQARLQAKKALGAVANGQDPQGERADRRDADKLTLRKAVDEFLAVKQRELRPRSFFETARYLTGAYFKPLHSMPLDTISRRDVATCIVRIARESGNPTASQARAKLSSFFVWCLQMGMVDANPVIGTPTPVESKSRERTLSDSELAAIWKACRDDEFGRIIRLLILSGCRRQEIGGMRWSEIDLERGAWTLSAERSKNGRAHTLPVLPMMRQIIESVPRMATRDQLFGDRAAIGFTGWHDCKPDLDQRSGVTEWHLHDLRRSVATRMADNGVQPHIIEQILNHQSGHKAGPAGIYNRSSYANEVRAALALWHDHIRTLVEGGERKVIPYVHTATRVAT